MLILIHFIFLLQNNLEEEKIMSKPTMAQEALKAQQWISVDDRLPDDDEFFVLVCKVKNGFYQDLFGDGRCFITTYPVKFLKENGITHWMINPEPPDMD